MQITILALFVSSHLVNCRIFLIYKNWSEWSTCERNCSNRIGFQKRTRNLLSCNGIDCEEFNQDAKFYKSSIKKLCYNATHCEGEGLYTGVYSQWELVNSQAKYKKYTRKCLPTWKTKANKPFKCSDLVDLDDTKITEFIGNKSINWTCERNDCDIRLDLINNDYCPKVHKSPAVNRTHCSTDDDDDDDERDDKLKEDKVDLVYYKLIAKKHLDNTWLHLKANQSDNITLNCDNQVKKILFDYFEKFNKSFVRTQWLHNSRPIYNLNKKSFFNKMHYVSNGSNLVIFDAKTNDSGVYVCYTQITSKHAVAVEIVSVEIGKPGVLEVGIGQTAVLKSNSDIFSLLFSNLSIKWTKEGKDIANSLAETQFYRNYDLKIENFNKLNIGLYVCRVYDNSNGRVWTTQRLVLKLRTNQYFVDLVVKNEAIISFVFGSVLFYLILSLAWTVYQHKVEILKLVLDY